MNDGLMTNGVWLRPIGACETGERIEARLLARFAGEEMNAGQGE